METPDSYEAALLVRRDNRGWFIFLYTPDHVQPDRDCQINENKPCTLRLPPAVTRQPKGPGAPRPWVTHVRFHFNCDARPIEKFDIGNSRVYICTCTEVTPRSEIARNYRWYSVNEVQAMLQKVDPELQPSDTDRAIRAALQSLTKAPIALAS